MFSSMDSKDDILKELIVDGKKVKMIDVLGAIWTVCWSSKEENNLGWKVMTNLVKILKDNNISIISKITAKAMAFQ